jgi:DoxX-like family
MVWVGRVASGLAIVFMLFDGVLHILKPAPVAASFAQLGYPLNLAVGLGVLELVCTLIYAVPRTAAPGAILLTGYLGGAVATQLRVGHSFFETIFPVIIAILAWGGLFVRDERVRAALSGVARGSE